MATATNKTDGAWRRFIKAIEPWYNWGMILVERMDELEETRQAGGEGEVGYFELQWLGIHFEMQIGRLPAKGAVWNPRPTSSREVQ
jgi:hypothetical protein